MSGTDPRTSRRTAPGSGRQRLPADYWRFWTASTLSNLGDGLRFVALPLLAAALTRSPLLVAGVSAFSFLPWILVGPLSGAVVDRVDRRRLIVVVQLVRGAAAATFAVAVAVGTVNIPILYVMAAVIGIGETLADTASQAAIPRLVCPPQLERANGRLLAGQIATNEALGAPVGGFLFAAAAALPFTVDAATYLIAAALVLTVKRDLGPIREGEPSSTIHADITEGLRWLWRHQLLRPLAVSIGVVNLGIQAQAAILVLFALDVLHVSETGFGILLGVGAIGGLAGATGAERLARRLGRTRMIVASTSVVAIASAVLGLAPNPVFAGAGLLVAMGSVTAFNVVGQTMRQAITPSRLLGRVVTAFRLVGLSSIPIGAVVGGISAELWGLRAPFLLGAALITVAAAVQMRALNDAAIDQAIAQNLDLQ